MSKTLEQAQQEINQLKVRIFDAEEAAKGQAKLVEDIVGFVVEKTGLEGVDSLESFGKALSEKFDDVTEDETTAE